MRVFIAATPRSRSVCLTRILEMTGKFHVFHEPLATLFSMQMNTEMTDGWFRESAFTSFPEIKRAIDDCSVALVKDMAFALSMPVNPEDPTGETLFDQLVHDGDKLILLYRNPIDSVASFNKKMPLEQLPMEYAVNALGYLSLINLYQKAMAKGIEVMLFPEECLETCLPHLFKFLGLCYDKKYLCWGLTDPSQKVKEWLEGKTDEMFLYWHGEALMSPKFDLSKTKHYQMEELDKTCQEVVMAISQEYEILKQL